MWEQGLVWSMSGRDTFWESMPYYLNFQSGRKARATTIVEDCKLLPLSDTFFCEIFKISLHVRHCVAKPDKTEKKKKKKNPSEAGCQKIFRVVIVLSHLLRSSS